MRRCRAAFSSMHPPDSLFDSIRWRRSWESGCGCRDACLPAADHRAARGRRGQPSAGGPGRAVGAAGRRQRGRCRGRDRAGALRRRADDVGARRRRVSIRSSTQRAAARSCSTAPARRPPRPRPSDMPAASRAPGRCRFRCRACSPALELMHRRFGRLPWRELFAEAIDSCPRRVWRHPRLLPFRRRISPDPARRSAHGRAVSRRRPSRRRSAPRSSSPISPAPSKRSPRTAPKPFTAAGWRDGLRPGSNAAGALVRAPAISLPSPPRSRRRSRSTTAATPCSKRRPIRPALSCSRN